MVALALSAQAALELAARVDEAALELAARAAHAAQAAGVVGVDEAALELAARAAQAAQAAEAAGVAEVDEAAPAVVLMLRQNHEQLQAEMASPS